MILHPPFEISARLMPAVRVGNAFISLKVSGRTTTDGRDIYEAYIDLPDGSEHEITDLRSGCQGGTVQEGMRALMSFLGAAVEARKYRERTTRELDPDDDSNESLFTPAIVDWATEHDDEISMLAVTLEESENLIEE